MFVLRNGFAVFIPVRSDVADDFCPEDSVPLCMAPDFLPESPQAELKFGVTPACSRLGSSKPQADVFPPFPPVLSRRRRVTNLLSVGFDVWSPACSAWSPPMIVNTLLPE